MNTAHLSYSELKLIYRDAKLRFDTAHAEAMRCLRHYLDLVRVSSSARADFRDKLLVDATAAEAAYADAQLQAHQLCSEFNAVHAEFVSRPYEPAVEPSADGLADLQLTLSCPTELKVWNPAPVPAGQPYHFGRLAGGGRTLDLLCGAFGDGLLTRIPGDVPKLAIPSRHFTLQGYNFADRAGIAAARAYVRRKLQSFSPI